MHTVSAIVILIEVRPLFNYLLLQTHADSTDLDTP